MRIYTGTGDDGTTGLQGGKRVSKTDSRIMAYGTIDELNAVLGVSIACGITSDMHDVLSKVQNDLFMVGADLSNPSLDHSSNRVSQDMVDQLETNIDMFEDMLEPLTNFILPGGSIAAAHIHNARAVARRAEIQTVLLMKHEKINPLCVVYLNRLSDMLFVLGRLANKKENIGDVIWKV